MKVDSSPARYTAPAAISSGVPRRPTSVWCEARAASSVSKLRRYRAVSTGPGDRLLTRIFCPAWSSAIALASWISAPLAAQYQGRPARATRPSWEAIKMMLPPPPASMARDGVLAEQEGAIEIDRHGAAPVGERKAGQRRQRQVAHRVRHQHVETAELVTQTASG